MDIYEKGKNGELRMEKANLRYLILWVISTNHVLLIALEILGFESRLTPSVLLRNGYTEGF